MCFFHATRIDKICSEKMERRKKRVKWAISVEKLSIGKTENSLESVLSVYFVVCVLFVYVYADLNLC